jgi:hypothetical protein
VKSLADELVNNMNNDTILFSSEKNIKEIIEKAVYDFKNKENYRSVYFNESPVSINFNIDDIETLAINTQSDINKIQKINNIVRYFINKNDILGKVYEAIETNVNPEIELIFPTYKEEDKSK